MFVGNLTLPVVDFAFVLDSNSCLFPDERAQKADELGRAIARLETPFSRGRCLILVFSRQMPKLLSRELAAAAEQWWGCCFALSPF